MPGNFIPKVTPGDDIVDHLTASTWNAFIDAANAAKDGGPLPNRNPLDLAIDPNIRFVRNDSGSARARYDILALSGVVFTPTDNLEAFKAQPLFTGIVPTLAYVSKFGILIDPVGTASATKYGRVAVAGTWVVKLQVDHEQHQYCDVAASSVRLTSNWYGSAKIHYKPTGTGEKWAIVRLAEPFYGPIKVVITQSGGIAPNGSGSAKVRWAGADASPTSTITVYYTHMPGASNAGQNKYADVFWDIDDQKLIIHNLQC